MDATQARVVIGYDGSEHARRALEWAGAETARRHGRLEVICVIDEGGLGVRGPVGMAHWWTDTAVEAGDRLAAQAVDLVHATWPDLDVRPLGCPGPPATVLVEASWTADLLVVGTRGRNPLIEMALGSVAETVAAHAHCPVVVVHRHVGAPPGPGHPVLVGVDDSPQARRALDLAADWAHRAAAPLSILCVSTAGETWGYTSLTADLQTELDEQVASAARIVLDAAVTRALDRHPDLAVTGHVLPGEPSQVLTEHAGDAGLIVVGSRGHGAFAGLVLGSVSHALVRTAPCAVTVVHQHAPTNSDEQARSGAEERTAVTTP